MSMTGILGDYRAFFAMQRRRLSARGIDISGCAISHLAYRTRTHRAYLAARDAIERHCDAAVENVWNGRPISKLLLTDPLDLDDGFTTDLVELIPPTHRGRYEMGLEHVGVVIGATVDQFGRRHRAALTGQQFQGPLCNPYFVTFDDHTNVKFYRYALMDVCLREGRRFDGFDHVDHVDHQPDAAARQR